MSRFSIGIMMLLASALTVAAGPGAVRKQVEGSMLVTGQIRIDPQGSVTGFAISQEEKLPAEVADLIRKSVPAWKFEPVMLEGRAVNAATDMNLRIVAKPVDKGLAVVTIRSASFGQASDKPEERLRSTRLAAPSYPLNAVRAGAKGTVYLLVKTGRDGHVQDAIVEQVNLKFVASESAMEKWRKVFAEASLRQAMKWEFIPPVEGGEADDEFWVARVPVVFSLDGERSLAYGKWEAYVPGPRQANPWEAEKEGAAFSPDALPPGGSYLAGSGLRLLTDLSGS